uniref:F-box protein PP2-B10-like n=1 Tax=Fragaria vesca subsp. vesca TaxID=101020 RepID=UPI0005CADF8C|nr:PREDICTED: F-box protein PP2-B10-like [Fragaria vesca subsp. vesca]
MNSAFSEEAREAGESLCERLLSYWAEREAYDKVATMEYVDKVVDYSDTKEEVIHLAPAVLDDTPPQTKRKLFWPCYANTGIASPTNMKTCPACSRTWSAIESDQVWEKFLPSPHLIHAIESQSTSSSTFVPAKSKKEFYLALCDNSVLMDNGKMSFSLDKWSGKKCYMICARELFIVWAQDKSRYWSWISVAESRFKEVASLDEVCWLEIRGKIDMSILSPWTLYKAYLVYKLTKRHYGFNVPVEVAIAERHYGFEYGPLDAALGDCFGHASQQGQRDGSSQCF